MLSKNVIGILIASLESQDDALVPLAQKTLESLKTVLAKEDVSPQAQISIMEQVLNGSGYVAFDKNTSKTKN